MILGEKEIKAKKKKEYRKTRLIQEDIDYMWLIRCIMTTVKLLCSLEVWRFEV